VLSRNKKIVKKNIFKKKPFPVSGEEKMGGIKKVLFFILLILFAGGAVWLLFFSSFVKIKHVKVIGFQEELVEEIVWDISKSFYLGFVPQDNILLIIPSKIKNKIGESLFLAQNIEVKKVFPDTIEIFLEKRSDVVVWCQGDSSQNCFLIDEKGEAFYKTNNGSNDFDVEFPIVFCKGNNSIEIGDIVVKSELVRFYSEISEFSQKEAGINLENNYYSPSFMSGEIRVRTDKGWEVYFNSFSTAQKQAKLLKSVLEKNIGGDNIGKLEYVDLRLSGKVLYKLREQETKTEEDESGEKNDDDSEKKD